jgi:hypothetical protein
MDNYYDSVSGQWVTDWDRYQAIAQQPPFVDLDAALASHPDRAWALLLDLLASVPPDTIHYVGSGPLEDFIHAHGAAFIAKLEAAAHSNARFQDAVVEVNLERGELPAPIEQRVLAAFGPRFRLLERNAG